MAVAVGTAALVALVFAPHPAILGIGVGLGTFVVLLVICFAIATALHAWHDHRRPGRLRR